jgi:hypothetical protein
MQIPKYIETEKPDNDIRTIGHITKAEFDALYPKQKKQPFYKMKYSKKFKRGQP